MKKIIKFILIVGLLATVVLGIFLVKDRVVDFFNKVLETTEVGSGKDRDGKNEFGLPIDEYGSSKDLIGANGNDYDKKSLDVKTSTATDKELEEALAKAKEDIQKEDIANTYTSLFENTNYTESKFEYELNTDMISVESWIDFQDNFYKEFEKAIARGENFLMYSTPFYPENVGYTDYSNAPCIYGYVKGLGYIIGAVTSDSQLVISIENKYFSKINYTIDYDNNKEFIWDVSTWCSNEDAVKVPVSGRYNRKAIYTDYSENMIRMTSEGFFRNDRAKDISNLDSNYCFFEGNFMNIIDANTAYHLFGLGFYKVHSSNSVDIWVDENNTYQFSKYDASKDNEFLLRISNDYSNIKLLTDFNNFFMSVGKNFNEGYNYALFGDLADIYLEKIISKVFSTNVKPCNDFDTDCGYIIGDAARRYYDLSELLWLFTNNDDGYIYPATNSEREAYSAKKYIGADNTTRYTCDASWYESLTEENRPYITSYVVVDNKLTVRTWERKWTYYNSLENHTLILNQELETNYRDYAKKVAMQYCDVLPMNAESWKLYSAQNPGKIERWAKEDNLSFDAEIASLVEMYSNELFFKDKNSGKIYFEQESFMKDYLSGKFTSSTSISDETNVFNVRFN